jgi:hypothetical protein
MLSTCRWRPSIGSSLLLAALFGCQKAETITTYETARTEPPPKAVNVEEVRERLDHMLAAIVPQQDKAWFFKLVVRGDAAAKELRKPFEEFIESIQLGKGDSPPTWKLPQGWVEKPGDAMRTATIEIPYGDEKLELAVSTLPLNEEWPPFVERNVNRWMGQLQQGPLSAETVAKLGKKTPIEGGGEATVFDLVGFMKATPGMGMPAGHPPVPGGMAAATANSPRPSDQTSPASKSDSALPTAAQPKEFNYEMPAGWQPGRTGGMRKAAFNVAEGGNQAEVTVMPFPASGAMADPLAQAQRWAGQVGLQLSQDQLKAAAKETTIDGTKGQLFELLGDAQSKPQAILAAMVERGDQVWFFKMTGDRPLVEQQRDAFAKFLESVKFADAGK